ncbi:ABC-2 type transport system ATP-binding protein [Candidatus Kinetoplastibacterium oncopeltii TCC290E]|uniref:ABC-2 type transport system ATP-binding protein n=1 Tax=Candidatus Kinetoplastidibacterium stringomonadis TCC290E TaxID=1208920 RepID=M1LY00_9PROT|nr:ABC transporter ATP-binding protein [Candidatus Kinetoplastibacterium oncopeltii]AGF48059.1 ABC-2 type transport system ATP-binding protein [Candidatus Kinetoplastibacterium oncopeltii TCC290E]
MFSISIEQLCKAYTPKGKSSKKTQALDNINLQIKPGEFFGLLGQNGAGKTSLISILSGLSFPTSGKVNIYGHDVVRDYRKARNLVGTVPQELVYDPFFTVRETLFIQSGYFGIKSNELWIEELLDNLSLTDKGDHDMRSLSGGMKRRVLIAQALVHRPPIIILDEPTAGVDIELRHTLWKFMSRLNKEGHTILLTTHYIEEAEDMCNRIAILKSGNLIALDETKNIISRFGGKNLEEAFVKIIDCNELSSINKEI